MNPNTTTEYRNLPLAVLTESATNPRRIYDNAALKELADFVAGHKISIMCRWPFCGRGGDVPHG